ncbi:hypothetical protein NPIL_99811 [Nephila pilipes]|uniref:Uncharacterized protein n=1 Tax=Nephila pilipes TaxID=299642 RepID=A0A8X6U7L1_NEPPI|nr:hypothetical protein NPIL_99811 [Nephila pilipes]
MDSCRRCRVFIGGNQSQYLHQFLKAGRVHSGLLVLGYSTWVVMEVVVRVMLDVMFTQLFAVSQCKPPVFYVMKDSKLGRRFENKIKVISLYWKICGDLISISNTKKQP